MSLIRKLKKIMKANGIEAEKVNEVVDDVNDLVEEEIESKTKEKDPELPKEKSEVELLKEEHAKELEKIKLDSKKDSEFGKLKVKEGYEDIVREAMEREDFKLDDKGELVGYKEWAEKFTKEKAILFNEGAGNNENKEKQEYEPNGGVDKNNPPKSLSDIAKDLNAHRIVK